MHYDESMMMSTSVYDEKTGAATPGTTMAGDSVAGRQLANNSNSKFNSFPMRQKKSKMMKQAPKSVSSLHADTLMKNHAANSNNNASAASQQGHHHHASRHLLVTYTEEELELNVRSARHRAQDGERLKQTIRTNCWPIRHPMRCYLWKCLLQVSGKKSNGSDLGSSGDEGGNQHASNKENQFKVELVANESDYNRHLDRIFGKCKRDNTQRILILISLIFYIHFYLNDFNYFSARNRCPAARVCQPDHGHDAPWSSQLLFPKRQGTRCGQTSTMRVRVSLSACHLQSAARLRGLSSPALYARARGFRCPVRHVVE